MLIKNAIYIDEMLITRKKSINLPLLAEAAITCISYCILQMPSKLQKLRIRNWFSLFILEVYSTSHPFIVVI